MCWGYIGVFGRIVKIRDGIIFCGIIGDDFSVPVKSIFLALSSCVLVLDARCIHTVE